MVELRPETIEIGHTLKGMQKKVLLNRKTGTVSNEGWELSFSTENGKIDIKILFNQDTYLEQEIGRAHV